MTTLRTSTAFGFRRTHGGQKQAEGGAVEVCGTRRSRTHTGDVMMRDEQEEKELEVREVHKKHNKTHKSIKNKNKNTDNTNKTNKTNNKNNNKNKNDENDKNNKNKNNNKNNKNNDNTKTKVMSSHVPSSPFSCEPAALVNPPSITTLPGVTFPTSAVSSFDHAVYLRRPTLQINMPPHSMCQLVHMSWHVEQCTCGVPR